MNTQTETKTLVEQVEELYNQAMDMKERKSDFLTVARDIDFNELCEAVLPASEENLFGSTAYVQPDPLPMNENGFGQMCGKLGKEVMKAIPNKKQVPSDFLLYAVDPDIRAELMKRFVSQMGEEKWFIRTYEDHVRSVLSEGYGVFDNHEILETLLDMVNAPENEDLRNRGQVVRSFVTPDELHVKVIVPNVHRSDKGGPYGVGFYVGNGETGNVTIRFYPVIQRHSCTNSIITERDGFREFHKGDIATKRILFKSNMLNAFGNSGDTLKRMLVAEEEKLPSFTDILIGMAKEHGWSEKERMTVMQGTEGQQTRAGIVNGVTYAAHKLHGTSERAIDMEILGGRLLDAKGTIFDRAARVGVNVREKEAAEFAEL